MDLTAILAIANLIAVVIILPAGGLLIKILWSMNSRMSNHLEEAGSVKSDISWLKKSMERVERKLFNGHD